MKMQPERKLHVTFPRIEAAVELTSATLPSFKMSERLGPEFLGVLADHRWLPFASEVKKSIYDDGTSGRSASERAHAIKLATVELDNKDLIYFVSSSATPSLTGWEINHRILLVTKEGLTNQDKLKSPRIYEDIFKGERETGVIAALSWKERYNSPNRLFVIEDSYVAIRSGFQTSCETKLKTPNTKSTGWGSEIYRRWLDFVELHYSPRDLLKIIVASKKIEALLCQKYPGAKELYQTFYGGGEAQGDKQRMYCFNRESPPRILLKTVKEAQLSLQPQSNYPKPLS